jgi:hypothetical protein
MFPSKDVSFRRKAAAGNSCSFFLNFWASSLAVEEPVAKNYTVACLKFKSSIDLPEF